MKPREYTYWIFGTFCKLTSAEYQMLKPMLHGHNLNSFLVSLVQKRVD